MYKEMQKTQAVIKKFLGKKGTNLILTLLDLKYYYWISNKIIICFCFTEDNLEKNPNNQDKSFFPIDPLSLFSQDQDLSTNISRYNYKEERIEGKIQIWNIYCLQLLVQL